MSDLEMQSSKIKSKDLELKASHAANDAHSKGSSNAALEAAINSAELYMKALRLADNAADRKRLDAKCKELLEKAESIKEAQDGVTSKPVVPLRQERKHPISTRKLTTRENIVLLEGAKLNGFVYKPWDKVPPMAEFELKEGHPLFTDALNLPLSEAQLASFAGWERPTEALQRIKINHNGDSLPTTPTMESQGKIDLVQDMTSDCSVVASLCAGTARAEKGHKKVSFFVSLLP